MPRRRLGIALLLLCLGPAAAPAIADPAPQLWLAPQDATAQGAGGGRGAPSYMPLFRPEAPWQAAARGIQVFKISTQLAAGAPEADLAALFADLRRRRIALALELLPQTATARCGAGVEGYVDAGSARRVAARIRRLGGDLAYVALDEPLWFGRHFEGPHACHSPIAAIAAGVAANLAPFRAAFPGLQVGDIEPLAAFADPDAIVEIGAWLDAAAATGLPLAFLHADLDWSGDWRAALPPLAALLHRRGLAFGVIYDGDADAPTDEAWTAAAAARFEAVEMDAGLRPDAAIVQSWMPRPRRVLPDDDPSTLTGLARRYRLPRPLLSAVAADSSVAGRLLEPSGPPVAGASVLLEGRAVRGDGLTQPLLLEGVVPGAAAIGLVALRAGTECGCSGGARLELGGLAYRDGGARDLPARGLRSHVVAAPGERLLLNGRRFPVVPGSAWRLEGEIRVAPGATRGAALGVIFLDAAGREVSRRLAPLQAAEVVLASAVTGRDGAFTLPLPPDPGVVRRIRFAGDREHRAAILPLP